MTNQSPNLRTAWYVVFVLMLAYISSFIDRQILSLLVAPIKRDMKLTDTEVSLLMGLSFAIFYTVLGIPIGRLADSKSRKVIIMVGIGFWSLMTALCGTVKNYGQFFLARIGVGVGEATLSPAAYSMITDYFPKEKLATALSVYSMGIYLGSGFAILIGATLVGMMQATTVVIPFVGEIFAWQAIFFYIGLPGFLLVLLMLTVREPARKDQLQIRNAAGTLLTAQVSVGEVLRYIRANWGGFLGVSLGVTFISTFAYGSSAWTPTYFMRVFGWSAAKAGVSYGLVVTIFSTLGVVTGGYLADRWTRKGVKNGKLKVGIIAACGVIVSSAVFFVVDPTIVILLMILPAFSVAMPLGAGAAAIQEIMPNQMRALSSAIYFFILNFIALGFGPTLVAVFTDYFFKDENMVGYSLSLLGLVSGVLALACFYFGQKPHHESLSQMSKVIKA